MIPSQMQRLERSVARSQNRPVRRARGTLKLRGTTLPSGGRKTGIRTPSS